MTKEKFFNSRIGQQKKYIEIISIFENKIISGELKPGDKIPSETELMEQLGVSRTPIREAIKILEAIGIIEIKRGEGMFLRTTTSFLNLNPLIMGMILQCGNMKELIEFRQYFEQMIIELVWKKCDAQEYEKLLEACKQLEDAVDTADRKTWIDMDMHFHYLIISTSHNPFISEIGKTVYGLFRSRMERVERDVLVSRENTIATHHLYLQAIKNKTQESLELLKQQINKNYANLYSINS